LSTTETALTAHLIKPDAQVDDALLTQIGQDLHDRYGIEHTTIQLEKVDANCDQAPSNVV
jgi:cobalt-zinc-cadmium efflux system protein